MPNDLYQWEAGGGLSHHCVFCFRPLTTPQSRTRCLGEHVEWCKRYHTQLFKKGTSHQCDPCRATDEEHHKRHREIAELLREIKESKLENPPASPLTPRAFNTITRPSTPGDGTPKTRKERKDAKKAQKISAMPKVVTSTDIEFVTNVLHPGTDSNEDMDIELQLLQDPDIKLNRFFHKNTSNRRDLRNEFIKKDRKNGKTTTHIDAEAMTGILQLLDVSPISTTTTTKEKVLYDKLKDCIETDLIHLQQEDALTMQRKAGFWRWASKKAYNRLIENGRIWSEKGPSCEAASGKSNGSTPALTSDTDVEVDESEVSELGAPVEEEDDIEFAIAALNMHVEDVDTDSDSKSPESPTLANPKAIPSKKPELEPSTPVSSADTGEWTTVAGSKKGSSKRKTKPKSPMAPLKLVANNGIAKLAQSSTPKAFTFLS